MYTVVYEYKYKPTPSESANWAERAANRRGPDPNPPITVPFKHVGSKPLRVWYKNKKLWLGAGGLGVLGGGLYWLHDRHSD